jgi:hypothetical protein
MDRLVRKLHGKAAHLVFACEAGPSRSIAWGHKRANCFFTSSEW